MRKIIVAGSGTDVGKTVVSAILAQVLQADYWKPIQCGDEKTSDTSVMRELLDPSRHQIHPPAYSFKAPLSPHHAARLEGMSLYPDSITLPYTTKPLLIECVGGVLVPLCINRTSLDLFSSWNARWVIVSRHYLGSINHTLLTVEALKASHVSIAGLIFNGEPNPDSEQAILELSGLPLLARLLPEKTIDSQTIQRYVQQWHAHILL